MKKISIKNIETQYVQLIAKLDETQKEQQRMIDANYSSSMIELAKIEIARIGGKLEMVSWMMNH